MKAAKEFKDHNLENITSLHRDICTSGIHLTSTLTAIFLDLPSPWLAINHPSFKKSFRTDRIGRVCSFSPSIEQVDQTCKALKEQGFGSISMVEVLAMEHSIVKVQEFKLPRGKEGLRKRNAEGEVKDGGDRVGSKIGAVRGHTSYLTFATLLPKPTVTDA